MSTVQTPETAPHYGSPAPSGGLHDLTRMWLVLKFSLFDSRPGLVRVWLRNVYILFQSLIDHQGHVDDERILCIAILTDSLDCGIQVLVSWMMIAS